jgi:hypothetical protein
MGGIKMVFFGLFALEIALWVVTILICAKDTECSSIPPTLNSLMQFPILLPYVVTAINVVFVVQILICKYLRPRENIQLAGTAVIYVTLTVTMVVFPFAHWDKNFATYPLLAALGFWMATVVWTFGRKVFVWVIASAVTYWLSSFAYMVIRLAAPQEVSGLLATEIACGLSIIAFLGSVAWKMEISKFENAGGAEDIVL